MTAPRKINPWLKIALEYGPILIFFLGYRLVKGHEVMLWDRSYDGIVVMTIVFVPLLALTSLIQWKLTGHLSKMQLLTLVLVVVFGGLTIWLNDDRFIKMKPTILYLTFALILGFGLLRGESYLATVMEEAVPMQPEGWMILTKRVALFFLALAAANEVVWRTMSDDAWVNFKTFGLTLGVFAFFMTQSGLFNRYALEDKSEE